MKDSIFTQIVNGTLPCHKVYEDDLTLAFLDIHPATYGHTLVIPKLQVEFVWDLPAAHYEAVMRTAQKVALRLQEVMKTTYIGEKVVGVDVPHAHVHLIPFNEVSEYNAIPDMSVEPKHEELAKLAKTLAF